MNSLKGRREFFFLLVFFAWAEQKFIIIVDEKFLFWGGHIMDFQGHFDTLLHPGVLGNNGVGGVIVCLRINVDYILRLNLHDIESGVSLNCDGFALSQELTSTLSF